MLARVSSTMDRGSPVDPATGVWTTRTLFARHKVAGISAVALLMLLLVIVVGGVLASSTAVVSDSSTCATWAAANQTQQEAYAAEYVREHGASPGGSRDIATVVAAISGGCNDTFSNDVEDSVTVVQAIKEG
jgi:hypothetical protein